MARITGTAGFGEASYFEAVSFDIDADDARPEWIPAVTREVPVMTEPTDGSEPEQATDPDTGAALTRTEVVTPGRQESLEEAVRKALGGLLTIDELERKGLDRLTATIRFTITGELEFDAADWGHDLDEFEVDPDYIDESFILENFEDELTEAAREAVRDSWESELELDIVYVEAE